MSCGRSGVSAQGGDSGLRQLNLGAATLLVENVQPVSVRPAPVRCRSDVPRLSNLDGEDWRIPTMTATSDPAGCRSAAVRQRS